MKRFEIALTELSLKQKIRARTDMGFLIKEGRKICKINHCVLCGFQTRFCNSHSIPVSVLENLKGPDGCVKEYKEIMAPHVYNDHRGVMNAGVFHLVCKKCDNEMFQNYESNCFASGNSPSNESLQSLALKNYLKKIYDYETHAGICYIAKRTEKYSYKEWVFLTKTQYALSMETNNLLSRISDNMWREVSYKVVVKHEINHKVPIAYQGAIPLITGLDGEIINDLYSDDKDFDYMHIAIFPRKNTTDVLVFIEEDCVKYNLLIERFDQLSVKEKNLYINKIVMWYARDFILSGGLDEKTINFVLSATEFSPDIISYDHDKSLEKSIKDFDLRRDTAIINLLE